MRGSICVTAGFTVGMTVGTVGSLSELSEFTVGLSDQGSAPPSGVPYVVRASV